MVHFKLPPIEVNEEGWGPTSVPEQFRDVPFMPFNKSDRLGRIADFGQQPGRGGYQGRYRDRDAPPGTSLFNFERADADDSFELVDERKKKPSSGPQRGRGRGAWGQGGRGDGGRGDQGGRGGWGGRGGDSGRGGRGGGWGGAQGGRGGWGGRFGGRGGWGQRDATRAAYTSSFEPGQGWSVVGDVIPLAALGKLSARVADGETLSQAGELATYDKAADRVTPKYPAKLAAPGAAQLAYPPLPPAAGDPELERLAAAGEGDVFTTGEVLAALAAAPRSVLPWDVSFVKRADGTLWMDKRVGGPIDVENNGETAPDAIPEDASVLNGVRQLAVEAGVANGAFRAHVLAGPAAAADARTASPAGLPASPARPATLFRYRRWTLPDGARVVARTTLDASAKIGMADAALAVHALVEFDPKWSGVDWRARLDSQRGAVLATELKNNAFKVARWTAAALLADADAIKLGYVSRAAFNDRSRHVLLGTQTLKPKDFAGQMNLSLDAGWGIVAGLIDAVRQALDGTAEAKPADEDAADDADAVRAAKDSAKGRTEFLLAKDATKPLLRLYSLPDGGLARLAAGEDDLGLGYEAGLAPEPMPEA